MSELTCIASTAPAEPTKLGTVGKLLPGMEMRIERTVSYWFEDRWS